MKTITIIIIITIIIFTPAFAFDDNIGFSKITPASPFYFLKGVREILEYKLAQTTRVKMIRQLEFATRRLREAKSLIGVQEDLIPPTLERYIGQLNRLTDKHQANDEFAPALKNNLVIHLEVLRNIYNQTSNSRTKMVVRSALNRVIQRADIPKSAKLPVCNLFTKEASSSALNETERFVLLERAKSCF